MEEGTPVDVYECVSVLAVLWVVATIFFVGKCSVKRHEDHLLVVMSFVFSNFDVLANATRVALSFA